MDYQGNSNKGKEPKKEKPEKVVEKVVKGEVVVRKTSLSSKFKGVFLGGDAQSAMHTVISEVILPSVRSLLVESVSKGMDRLIYGDQFQRRRSSSSTSSYQPRVQYNNPLYRQGIGGRALLPDQPTRWISSAERKPFEDITFGTKEDADSVIENLMAIVEQYEIVSVADLYEMIGVPSSHIDNKWGWTGLASLALSQTRDGWKVSFPPVEEIS